MAEVSGILFMGGMYSRKYLPSLHQLEMIDCGKGRQEGRWLKKRDNCMDSALGHFAGVKCQSAEHNQ